MLRAIERDFQVYPPYWMYRGKTAQALGNDSEANSCFERFNEVWRPVLRQDPYKVEALKFGLSEIVNDGNLSGEEKRRAFGILEDMTANTPRDDWANKLFVGVAYFLLGEKDRGIEIVESNVDFGYGAEVSGAILTQLKKGKLHLATLLSDIAERIKNSTMEKRMSLMKDKQLAEVLITYFEGRDNEAEKALENIPVVFYALYCMNALKNYPKAAMYLEKTNSLYNKDKEAVNQAFAEVKPLLELYAKKQVPSAQFILGAMYYNGYGVEKDYAEAFNWWSKSVEQGYVVAQNNLGLMYYNGYGVEKDYVEAFNWWSKSAEQGLAWAQNNLGDMYYYGRGVKEDYAEAAKWYRKAAEQGNAGAQYSLGDMYYYGRGVKQNYKTACIWYCIASLNGHSRANDRLRYLEKGGWFSSALVSPSEAIEARAEAMRKYHEIRKRYGLD